MRKRYGRGATIRKKVSHVEEAAAGFPPRGAAGIGTGLEQHGRGGHPQGERAGLGAGRRAEVTAEISDAARIGLEVEVLGAHDADHGRAGQVVVATTRARENRREERRLVMLGDDALVLRLD